MCLAEQDPLPSRARTRPASEPTVDVSELMLSSPLGASSREDGPWQAIAPIEHASQLQTPNPH